MSMSYLKHPKTNDEFGRQRALDRLEVLDTPKEPEFERITALVKSIFNIPVVAVTLIDRRRQWFKSVQGLDITETSRDVAFCNHTIRENRCLKIEDATLDPRFAQNPLVTGAPGIRAYLGAPLVTADGYLLGSLCVIDFEPRSFSPEQEGILESFAKLVMGEMELRRIASTDELTRLSNRRVFNETMGRMNDTYLGGGAGLILFDLDHFKGLNDAFGHPAGDRVLQRVAELVKDVMPAGSVACRIGGEEFAILLTPDAEPGPGDLAETLRAGLAALVIPEIGGRGVTASFGIALSGAGQSQEDWFEAADAALYRAKENGRNQVRRACLQEA
jgi:diguanylate cyclase (GGDEF)-like protein